MKCFGLNLLCSGIGMYFITAMTDNNIIYFCKGTFHFQCVPNIFKAYNRVTHFNAKTAFGFQDIRDLDFSNKLFTCFSIVLHKSNVQEFKTL